MCGRRSFDRCEIRYYCSSNTQQSIVQFTEQVCSTQEILSTRENEPVDWAFLLNKITVFTSLDK